jgi:acetyltransferase-like isoleucine patch superfamily enzyme
MIGNIMNKSARLIALMHRVTGWLLKKTRNELARKDERYENNRIGPNVDLGTAVLQGGCVIKHPVFLRGDITIGKYSTLGPECVLHGGVIQIGNYCQLGPRVAVYALNHPMNRVTTYVNSTLLDGKLKTSASDETVIIGNDVWIGYGAVILPGINIGNGAVIGAGAVVSRNIGSYEVAAGNPARIVKKRFDPELIELLSEWEWWKLDPDELKKHEEIFLEDVISNPEVLRKYLKKIAAR